FGAASRAGRAAVRPAASLRAAATHMGANSAERVPLWMIRPKRMGATVLAPAAIEKNRAMAMPRISTGNSSLTVRYAELAADDATKKTTHQASVCVIAVSQPLAKAQPVSVRRTPERT